MKGYIDSALKVTSTPLYLDLCNIIVRQPKKSQSEINTIKKMLLNAFYTSSDNPYEHIGIDEAECSLALLLWACFSGFPNKYFIYDLFTNLRSATDEVTKSTLKMVSILYELHANQNQSGIWKRFNEELKSSQNQKPL